MKGVSRHLLRRALDVSGTAAPSAGQSNSAQTTRPVTATRRLKSISLDLRGTVISFDDKTIWLGDIVAGDIVAGDMAVFLGRICRGGRVNGSLMAGGLSRSADPHCEADHT
jgi:hypothetical protein